MIETRQILEELPLKNVLATSSTGAVFLAEDPATGSDVVIKVVSCAVPGAEEEVRQRFLAMTAAARSVRVAAMPGVSDHGLTPEGDGFAVMEYVEGRTLDTIEDLSPFAAINILLDVLSCIEGLASIGTAHLNITPTNVFLTAASANDRAVVLGFGTSAALIHAGAGAPVPAHDPHHAPELVSGNILPPEECWRSDLFSLGVIACGVLGAEIQADGYEKPVVTLPPEVRAALPEAEPLEQILAQIMDPDPRQRGVSASDPRDPLIRALPDPPPLAAVVEEAPAVPATKGFDPNKTDPALVPSAAKPADEVGAPPRGDVVEAVSEETVAVDIDDGWPAVLFDDPALPTSLVDHEDTDVRNPVPQDVWVPDKEPLPATDSGPTATAPGGQARGGRRVSRLELAVVAIVVVVLGSILAFTWPSGDEQGTLTVGQAVPIGAVDAADSLVPPPPDTNLFDDLLAIQVLVDAGDLDGARAALNGFEDRRDLSLNSDESALYNSLASAVSIAADREAAINDLRAGLEHGSIRMIRRGAAGLAGMPRQEIVEVQGLADDLERARRVLNLHSEMWEAEKAGDELAVIRYGGELQRELPGYGGAPEVREHAAVAMEVRAESNAAAGDYDAALVIFESLDRAWPNRAGLAERISRCRELVAESHRAESVISRAMADGRAGDPEAGLAKLDGVDTDPEIAETIEEARSALRAQLDAMDVQAPRVELATTMELGFKKNATLVIPLRVTDDYRVERVVVHARNQGDDGYLQIPLDRGDDGLYHFTVTPELHGNKDVSFYVTADDRSDHEGRLGSPEAPLTIERKKWFKKLG